MVTWIIIASFNPNPRGRNEDTWRLAWLYRPANWESAFCVQATLFPRRDFRTRMRTPHYSPFPRCGVTIGSNYPIVINPPSSGGGGGGHIRNGLPDPTSFQKPRFRCHIRRYTWWISSVFPIAFNFSQSLRKLFKILWTLLTGSYAYLKDYNFLNNIIRYPKLCLDCRGLRWKWQHWGEGMHPLMLSLALLIVSRGALLQPCIRKG
jgi:hypothetical protein